MPLYRFNTYGWQNHLDDNGVELPDANAACQHAIWSLGELLKDNAKDGASDCYTTMIVFDEAGVAVCELSFSVEVK